MISTSLCVVAQGESAGLEACLRSGCRCFDEIIFADAGADSLAREVGRRFADRYFHFDWNGDAAAARNFAFSKTACDYIMWLEPEDVLLPADEKRLWQLRRSLPPDTDAVTMRHNIGFDGQGRANICCWPVRMVRRASGLSWQGKIAPRLPAGGTVRLADVTVTRRAASGENAAGRAKAYDRMRRAGEPFLPSDRLDYARSLRDSGRTADAALEFEEFLRQDGEPEDRIEACFELSFCYERMGDPARMADALFHSLLYAPPRPAVCCRIGEIFFSRRAWQDAAYWYETALKSGTVPERGIRYTDYDGYIPALQLCLCYYRMGNTRRAEEMNRTAARFKPRDKSVLANEKFFAGLRRQ